MLSLSGDCAKDVDGAKTPWIIAYLKKRMLGSPQPAVYHMSSATCFYLKEILYGCS